MKSWPWSSHLLSSFSTVTFYVRTQRHIRLQFKRFQDNITFHKVHGLLQRWHKHEGPSSGKEVKLIIWTNWKMPFTQKTDIGKDRNCQFWTLGRVKISYLFFRSILVRVRAAFRCHTKNCGQRSNINLLDPLKLQLCKFSFFQVAVFPCLDQLWHEAAESEENVTFQCDFWCFPFLPFWPPPNHTWYL